VSKRILMIVTSTARMGDTDQATGIWAAELAVPYYRLTDAGAEVTVASTAGGAVPLDPRSVKPKGENDAEVERLLADAGVQAKLRATPVVSAVNTASFDAVFFPGGHGAMWDLPIDGGVRQSVEAAFAAGKLIASVCHGAAGLVSARRADGKAVIEGHRINSFTDAEEEAVGLTAIVPFLLESRLRELGAQFLGAPNWEAFAIRDRQFITGQNPQSSARVAEQVLDALGLAGMKSTA
jgi:putative intracellular protease/amidase